MVTLTGIFSQRINKGMVVPLPVEFTRCADPATICHGKIVGDCLRGDRSSTEKPILVLGDSHAAMLNHFFDVVGKELKLSFRVITASSCVTIPKFDYQRIPDWTQKDCLSQIEEVNKILFDYNNIIITSMWTDHLRSKKFEHALHAFLTGHNNKNFLLLADIPHFENYNAARFHRLLMLGLGSSIPMLSGDVRIFNRELDKIARKYINVEYLNLTGNVMFDEIPIYKGRLLYHDSHHFNEVGSKLYANQIKGILKFYFESWLN